MSIRHSAWRQGIPCWVDLTAGDVTASWAFYSAVLGWTPPAGEDLLSRYQLVSAGGAAVAGITRHQVAGPAGWTIYLAADDADTSVAAAVARGATSLLPPEDVEGGGDGKALGRRAVLADPFGARIGLWQAGSLNGLQLVNQPGGLCFEELRSPDPTASANFYANVFDYTLSPEPPYGPDYTSFRLADEQVVLGGIRAVDPGQPVNPGWLPFFGVADADCACQQTVANGGSVILPAFATPDDRVALLADPEGCPFWVLTSTGEEQPDRSG
jgi:predicted enzyme related to lactoylglutathione lyase